MKKLLGLTAGTAALATLAGCVETGASAPSAGMPRVEEQACLRDVTRTTNNPDVVLLGSSVEGMGMEVIVGVGPQRARWRCVGFPDGTTAGIMSMTDEGAL
jgi:hypothetical protein